MLSEPWHVWPISMFTLLYPKSFSLGNTGQKICHKIRPSPCPSFPWLFCFHQGKTPKLPRILLPYRMPRETQEKTSILTTICLAKNQPRKSKQPRKGRTGLGRNVHRKIRHSHKKRSTVITNQLRRAPSQQRASQSRQIRKILRNWARGPPFWGLS